MMKTCKKNSTCIITVFGLFSVIIVLASVSCGVPLVDNSSEWPMFGHDPYHSFSNPKSSRMKSLDDIELLWTFETDSAIKSTAAVSDLDGDGNPEIIFGSDDKKLYVLKNNGDLLWTFKTEGAVVSSPAVADIDNDGKKEIIFGSEDGNIYCLDTRGATKWVYHTKGKVTASPTIVNVDGDKNTLEILIGSWDKNFYVLNSKGSEILTFETRGEIESSATIGDVNGDGRTDIIIGSDDNKVYVIDTPLDGKPFKRVATYVSGGDVVGSPIAVKEKFEKYPKIFAVSTDGILNILTYTEIKEERKKYDRTNKQYKINSILNTKLQKLREYATDGEIVSNPAQSDLNWDGGKEVIFGSNDKVLYIFDMAGNKILKYSTNDKIVSSPAISDFEDDGLKEVVVSAIDGNLYILNPYEFTKWTYKIPGGKVTASPIVVDINKDGNNEIIIGSWDGKLYVFGKERDPEEYKRKLEEERRKKSERERIITKALEEIGKSKDNITEFSNNETMKTNSSLVLKGDEKNTMTTKNSEKILTIGSIGSFVFSDIGGNSFGIIFMLSLFIGTALIYLSYNLGVQSSNKELVNDERLIDDILLERRKRIVGTGNDRDKLNTTPRFAMKPAKEMEPAISHKNNPKSFQLYRK